MKRSILAIAARHILLEAVATPGRVRFLSQAVQLADGQTQTWVAARRAVPLHSLAYCGAAYAMNRYRSAMARAGAASCTAITLAWHTKKVPPRCCLKAVPAEAFDGWMVDELLAKVLTVQVVEKVVKDIRANGGRWAEDRELRRCTLVKDMRETEGRRNNLYDILETQGKGAPNLADVTTRLRQLNETIRWVERALQELEDQPAPDYDLVDVDPQQAVETIRGLISGCADAKRLRALLATFVQAIAVSNATVIVEYREDALLRSPTPTVHSGVRCLLDLGSNQGPTD